ncbi:MAG: hypothetical protein ACM3IJ_03965 [Candidatus Levyibacteriota bacterium]
MKEQEKVIYAIFFHKNRPEKVFPLYGGDIIDFAEYAARKLEAKNPKRNVRDALRDELENLKEAMVMSGVITAGALLQRGIEAYVNRNKPRPHRRSRLNF